MPGIDYTLLRQELSLAQVLDLIGFTATSRRGPQLRGPCPVHGSTTPQSRSFAAHLDKHCWHCFRAAPAATRSIYTWRRPGCRSTKARWSYVPGCNCRCRDGRRHAVTGQCHNAHASRRDILTEPTPRRAVELHRLTEASQGRTPPRKRQKIAIFVTFLAESSARKDHAMLPCVTVPDLAGFDWPAARPAG